jgi:hypothetical protein
MYFTELLRTDTWRNKPSPISGGFMNVIVFGAPASNGASESQPVQAYAALLNNKVASIVDGL